MSALLQAQKNMTEQRKQRLSIKTEQLTCMYSVILTCASSLDKAAEVGEQNMHCLIIVCYAVSIVSYMEEKKIVDKTQLEQAHIQVISILSPPNPLRIDQRFTSMS